MQTKRYFLLKIFALSSISLLLLTSCGGGNESPNVVIQKFKEQTSVIKSGDLTAHAVVKGVGLAEKANEKIDLNADLTAKFDRREGSEHKADVKLDLGGSMNSADKNFQGSLGFNFISVSEDYFLKIDKLEVSDDSLQTLQPFLQKYQGKWLHIAKDFIPENIRSLQGNDEASKAKEEQLKKIFTETNLFSVSKEYGVEKVNGYKAYHYGIQLNPEGVRDYVRKVAMVDGRELTDAEVEDSVKISSALTDVQLWIGIDDYYLYKASVSFAGGSASNTDIKADITMDGNAYNEDVTVQKPEGFEEFNPLELLMGGAAMESLPPTEEQAAGGEGNTVPDQVTLDALKEAQEGAGTPAPAE